MIQVGLAEAYKGRPVKGFNPKPYKIAEQEARKNMRGMWLSRDKYISPYFQEEMK
jgi:endonuclease YncB( thermonuclease family)